jgi:hypothetical protein
MAGTNDQFGEKKKWREDDWDKQRAAIQHRSIVRNKQNECDRCTSRHHHPFANTLLSMGLERLD